MRTLTTIIVSLLMAAFVVAAAGLILVYSGSYNVAATDGHQGIVSDGLNLMKERSIRAHSEDVSVTPPTDSVSLQRGYQAHDEMCVPCHGAPGVERGWMGKGMNPQPPELADVAGAYSHAELYWTVRHGIKLAGMPAMEPTHEEAEMLEIVAFVDMLPDMTEEEYAEWGRTAAASEDTHAGHDHEH